MKSEKKEFASSVLARLLNHSRTHQEEYQSLLIRYVSERFLFRLGKSSFRDKYLLKGAYLLSISFKNHIYRATKDIDFLKIGKADSNSIRSSLQKICNISYPEDAVEFDPSSITLQDIREQNAYKGIRAKIKAHIGKARAVIQIDIGIGDSVYPEPTQQSIPSLLEMDGPKIRLYPIETVIAEKLEALISLSLMTSRMKDFYDLYCIINSFKLNYIETAKAIKQTFLCRKTKIPEKTPLIFSDKAYHDPLKLKQWKAFTVKLRNENSSMEFEKAVKKINEFSSQFWKSAETEPKMWNPDTGWK